MGPQSFRIEDLAGPDALSGGLVAVAGSDSPLGGSDLVVGRPSGLLRSVEQAVVGHDQVRPDIDPQVPVKLGGDSCQLALHGVEVDDRSYSDDADRLGIEDAGGHDVKRELAVFVDDGMSGVVSALVSDDHVRVCREVVYDPSLSFIAPLGADD